MLHGLFWKMGSHEEEVWEEGSCACRAERGAHMTFQKSEDWDLL